MNTARRAMVSSARSVQNVLVTPAMEKAWEQPSALGGFTVGGLAAHVTTVLASCHRCIDDPETTDAPLPPEDYYTAFGLADTANEANALIVSHGEERAAHGAEATRRRFEELLTRLEQRLEQIPEDRVVQIFGAVPMKLDDFFVTRALEFCVHADDLGCSIGVTPEIDRETIDLVISHLLATARHRHGDLSVLRAFARRERDEAEALRVF